MAFRVMLRMQIHRGTEAEFEDTWRAVGASVTEHPANLAQWLSRAHDEAGDAGASVYYIVSDWVDEARFREFEASERHVRHREQLHPYRSSGSMTTMTVVAHVPGAAALAASTPGDGSP